MPVFVAAVGFVVRFLRLGAIENDHYVYLARAHQMLRGDWPVRDFVDPGFTLGYLLSAAAAAVAGPTLLTEAVLSGGLFAAALGVTYARARRASGSIGVALLAAVVVLLLPPRLYNSSKMLVPLVAIAFAWAYCDRPLRVRVAALGAWTGIGFLFRHDYAVYIAAVTIVMLLVQHWNKPRVLMDRAIVYGLTAALVVAPWLVYVQMEQGVREYLVAAMRFSAAEGARTVSRWAPVYYVMAAVPIAALLFGIRGTRQLSGPQVMFAALLVFVSDLVLLRDDPGSRLPDVYAPTLVIATVLVGVIRSSDTRARQSIALGVAAAAVIVAAGIASTNLKTRLAADVNLFARWRQVAMRLREARSDIIPDPSRAPLVAFLARCTRPEERVFVAGFGPELPVLAHRAFAGGLPDWIRGYYIHPDDVARARRQLSKETIGAAVMLDGGDAFRTWWPAVAQDLRARGLTTYYLPLDSGPIEVWLPPRNAADPVTRLPCANRPT